MVVDGAMVLVIAFGWLAFIWIVVIYGSGFFGERMQTLESDGARSVSGTRIVLRTDEARQGVTGHNVRYVLIFGLVGAVVGLTVIGILFAH